MRTNDILASRGMLPILQVLGGPLAIVPAARQQLLDIVQRHARDDARDITAIRAKLGISGAPTTRDGYQVSNGVAILPVQGAIFPKSNLLIDVSGGASAQLVARDVAAAATDPTVSAIVLSIDSPGGSVAGIPEAAQAVREAARVKPVVTYSDGALASAAYWLGSAANSVFVSGPTVMAGSIGVVATHTDLSRANAAAGVMKTDITAGKYKGAGSSNRPLDAGSAAVIQAQVDYLYGLFVDAVAASRGAPVNTVLEKMADGRIFIGQQAIDAGLVDGMTSLDALVADLAANPSRYATRGRPPFQALAAVRAAAPGATVASAVTTAHSTIPLTPMPAPKATAMPEPVPRLTDAQVREQRAAACKTAGANAVATFNRANGIKPSTAAGERTGSKPAAATEATSRTHAPAKTAGAPVPSDPKADAARAVAQQAAARSAVALFVKVNGEKNHE